MWINLAHNTNHINKSCPLGPTFNLKTRSKLRTEKRSDIINEIYIFMKQ